MTILEPRQAYTRLAENYDSTPNALIALEERMMAPLLLRESPAVAQASRLRGQVGDLPHAVPDGLVGRAGPRWRRLPACGETCPTEFLVGLSGNLLSNN